MLSKSATTTPGWQPPAPTSRGFTYDTSTGVANPYAAPVMTAEKQRQQNPSMGRIGAEMALDTAASFAPVGIGAAYFGGKAINDFAHGNWGRGLGNVAMGAMSFVPGLGLAAKGAWNWGKNLLRFGAPMATSAVGSAIDNKRDANSMKSMPGVLGGDGGTLADTMAKGMIGGDSFDPKTMA